MLKEVIASLEDFWSMDHNKNYLENVQRKVYNFIHFTIKLTYLFAVCVEIILPAIRKKTLLLPDLYHSEVLLHFPYYGFLTITNLISYFTGIHLIVGMPGIYYFLITFCYFQLRMLNESIKNINFGKGIKEDVLYMQLIMYYNYLIKITR